MCSPIRVSKKLPTILSQTSAFEILGLIWYITNLYLLQNTRMVQMLYSEEAARS